MADIIPLFPNQKGSRDIHQWPALAVSRAYCDLIEAKMQLPQSKVSAIDREFAEWLKHDPTSNNPMYAIHKLIEIIQSHPNSPIQNTTITYFLERVKSVPIWKMVSLKKWLCEVAEVPLISEIPVEANGFILEYLRTFDLSSIERV